MNPVVVLVLAVLAAAVLPPRIVQDAIGTAGATLFEGAPFILAAAALERFVPLRSARLAQLLGCGCGAGPAALSLPAAATIWLAFGPWAALARLAAALAVAHLVARRRNSDTERGGPLGGIAALLPYALAAGAASHLLPLLAGAVRLPPWGATLAGAAFGFVLAPCGLGAAGVAGALRAVSPAACAGFLCVAGIADARAFARSHAHDAGHDGFAYGLCALACAAVAARGGAALVHPRFAIPLWACTATFAVLAAVHRHERRPLVWVAPGLMLAAIVFGAPHPTYRASATSLADAFPGERLAFDGVVTRDGDGVALVRYAIACCRADAAPVVVRLARDVPRVSGAWLRVDGVLETHDGALRLRVARAKPIAPPGDPYLYR